MQLNQRRLCVFVVAAVAAGVAARPLVSRRAAEVQEEVAPAAVGVRTEAVGASATAAHAEAVPVVPVDWARAEMRQDVVWQRGAQEGEFAAFKEWTQRYAGADAGGKRTLVAEGRRFATSRRAAFKRTMRENPERALELAVPVTVRRTLPPEVLAQLEWPVDARGDLEHFAAMPAPGAVVPPEPDTYEVKVSGNRLRAFVTAARAEQPSRYRVPIHGYKLDEEIVVRPTAGRLLEPVEVAEADAAQGGAAVCPVSNLGTQSKGDEAGLAVGGDTHLFCEAAHAALELEERTAAEQSARPEDEATAAAGDSEVIAASTHTEGVKTILFIRVDFSDDTSPPVDGAVILPYIASRWADWSSGRCTVNTAACATTPILRMPKAAGTTGYNGDSGALYTDALAAATAGGYTPGNYSFVMVCMDNNTPGFGYAGLGTVGGNKTWLRAEGTTYAAQVATHELGHNLGLNHAHSYVVNGSDPIAGGGTTSEYGDPYNTMGSGNVDSPYNARYKLYLNWLTSAEYYTLASGGIYRIAAHDKAGSTGYRGLKILRTGTQDYCVDYMTERTGTQATYSDNGVQIRWGGSGATGSTLLDITSGSSNGLNDAPLALGQTFSDPTYGIYFTTMAKVAGATFDSMDVLVSVAANTLPPLWTSADIGAVGKAGVASYTGGSYNIHGSGADIWSTADAFRFSSQSVTGDCDLRARVVAQANTNTNAKAGLMLRDGTAANAMHAAIYSTPSTFYFQYRTAAGNTTISVTGAARNAPPNNWVRLARTGSIVKAYVSADGATWTQLGGNLTINFPTVVKGGLAVCGHANPTLGAAAFDNVTLSDSAPLTTLANDTFDLGAATAADDPADPLDLSWSITGGALTTATDTTLGSGKALNVDATTTLTRATAAIAGRTLTSVGDSLKLTFDFRYTVAPASTAAGFRFGIFNAEGDGFCVHHGDGGNTGYAVLEDTNGGFGSGTLNTIASATKTTIGTTAKHTASLTLQKLATGISVTSAVDGVALTGTDSTPAITAFDTIAIRNGNVNADFRVDNVRVDFTHVAPPVWSSNPLTKPAAGVGVPYSSSIVSDVTTPGALTFSKISGNPWLIVAASGALSGTPAPGVVGANTFVVRATNEAGDFTDTTLNITVFTNTLSVVASVPAATEDDSSPGIFLITRTGSTASTLIVDFTATGTATSGADYVAIGSSTMIPAGQASATVNVTPIDDSLLEGDETVILTLAQSASYAIGSPANATITIADDESFLIRMHDAFDTIGATPGDDANDPSDAAWTGSGATLSIVADATIGAGSALNVDATGTFALARSSFAPRALTANGDTLTLTFDFRYTESPANVATGFRFGFFNNSGDGLFAQNGTGGTTGLSVARDYGVDAGYGAGSTTGSVTGLGTGTPISLNDLAKHSARVVLRKVATGITITAVIDGVSSTGTDTAPPTSTFTTVGIRNGGVNADFRIDTVHVEFAPNLAPVFTADPLVKSAAVATAYSATLATDTSDPNSGDTITFTKISGPAWLAIAANGALSGTPGAVDAGANSFVVRATDNYGLATDATLIVNVGYPVTVTATSPLAPDAGYAVASPANATVVIADNEVTAELVNDTFDIGSPPTIGDDTEDSLDAAWSGSAATIASDTTGIGTGNALAVDSTGTFAYSIGTLSSASLINPGDVLTLTFDFRYTEAAPNSGSGFRFGLQNSAGAGYCTIHGTGGDASFSLNRGPTGSFGAGAAVTGLSTSTVAGTPASIADQLPHACTFVVSKTSAGLVITSTVNGCTKTATDASPVITSFDTILIRNGGINADYRFDNVRVSLTRNRAPLFTSNPIAKPTAFAGVSYSDQTLTADAADPNSDDVLTFTKISGPAWLTVAPDGTLSGTPSIASAGPNTFTVRVADDAGLFTDAMLTIVVVNAPIENWRQQKFGGSANDPSIAGNDADPDGDGISNLLEFALDGDPKSDASAGLAFANIKTVGGSETLTYTIAVRSGATFTAAQNRQTATIVGLTYTIEATSDLASWSASEAVAEVLPALSTGLAVPESGWEYHTFRAGGVPAATARTFIRVQVGTP